MKQLNAPDTQKRTMADANMYTYAPVKFCQPLHGLYIYPSIEYTLDIAVPSMFKALDFKLQLPTQEHPLTDKSNLKH